MKFTFSYSFIHSFSRIVFSHFFPGSSYYGLNFHFHLCIILRWSELRFDHINTLHVLYFYHVHICTMHTIFRQFNHFFLFLLLLLMMFNFIFFFHIIIVQIHNCRRSLESNKNRKPSITVIKSEIK